MDNVFIQNTRYKVLQTKEVFLCKLLLIDNLSDKNVRK